MVRGSYLLSPLTWSYLKPYFRHQMMNNLTMIHLTKNRPPCRSMALASSFYDSESINKEQKFRGKNRFKHYPSMYLWKSRRVSRSYKKLVKNPKKMRNFFFSIATDGNRLIYKSYNQNRIKTYCFGEKLVKIRYLKSKQRIYR